MINTQLENFKNDLCEVVNLFDDVNTIDVKHLFSEKDGKVVNTVIVGGKSYSYGNLLPPFSNEIEHKRYVKRYAKLSMYKALSVYFNKSLPWGALTGIRPTKLAYSRINSKENFNNYFQDVFKVSREKTELTERVIKSQEGIYSIDDDNTDFFIFIPFCPSRCKYCSFISSDVKSAEKYIDLYVDTLIKEINHSKKYIKKLRSIYIGGGTPVALKDEQLERILCAVDDINTGVEFTVEAGRPDRITKSNLEMLKKHRVTRICINPQTFCDETLLKLRRNHTAQDVFEKYEMAKGMFDINMDLIAGLEGENFDIFKSSLDKTINLGPENITVHTLCVKRGSSLAESQKRISSDEVEKMVDYSYSKLLENGYNPYYLYRQKYMAGNLENVGYSKENKACIYNVDIMEEIAQNVSCGANAVSKRVFNGGERIERYASPKDVKTYIEKIDIILSGKDKLFD